MDNHTSTSRAEAERLLGLAEKLLSNKDLAGSKKFATLAQETEPLLEGCDQIVAIIEVLLASEKRVNNHPDWYSVLQIAPKVNNLDLVKRQFRRLALLLHPDKNKFAFAESAFHLVSEAWGVLSDPVKKRAFDSKFGLNITKVDLQESRRKREMEMMQNMQDLQESSRKREIEMMKNMHDLQESRKKREMEMMQNMPDLQESSRKREIEMMKNMQDLQESRKKREMETMQNMQDLQESRRKREMEMLQNMQNQNPSRDKFLAPTVGVASYSSPVKKRGRPIGRNSLSGGERGGGDLRSENFWTGCPYCYHLFEYPRMYEGYCMGCLKCKTFSAEGVGYEPPIVPGREEYYCCWGMFPMGSTNVDQAGRGEERLRF